MKKSTLASFVFICTLTSTAAFASDGTVSFNGSVAAPTCTINGSSPSFTVTLPTVSAAAFPQSSFNAGRTAFSIALTNCDNAASVRVYFESGANVSGTGTALLNRGTAQGIGIGLVSQNGATETPIIMGTATQGSFVSLSSGAATLQYSAFYTNFGNGSGVGQQIVPGTVTTSVTYKLEYQ